MTATVQYMYDLKTKQLHETMTKELINYKNLVKWIYKQFFIYGPLVLKSSLHPAMFMARVCLFSLEKWVCLKCSLTDENIS